MQPDLPVVVLVGRPNVGKSTLFNRLTDTRDALVADRPGVTRDRQYGVVRAGERRFLVVDTGGLGVDDAEIDALAAAQTDIALAEAHAVVFLVDGRDGLLPGDLAIADRLRHLTVPVYPVVNKTEGRIAEEAVAEFHALGMGAPDAISASHGGRIEALIQRLVADLPPSGDDLDDGAAGTRLAVVGRPNAGKSTLVNRLLGESRMLTMDAPGTTRDAVAAEFEHDGERFRVVDTAGIRRRSRIEDPLEKFSVIKAMQAAESAHIVVIMVDAQRGLEAQDVRLLGLMVDLGRAVVLAINKWDGLDQERRRALREDLRRRLVHLDFMTICTISAKHGSGLRELMAAVREARDAAGADLSTGALTRVLEQAVLAHAPPALHGRRIKLRYAHQGGRNPPRIVIHGNQTARLSAEYKRYLMRRFRDAFGLRGTPVELVFRTGENPYDKRGPASARKR